MPTLSMEEKTQEFEYNAQLIDSVAHVMLPCHAKNFEYHKQLIQQLSVGTQQASYREAFALHCYKLLFEIASCQEENGT